MQNKLPDKLPKILKNWDFIPLPLRSLQPYDKILAKMKCCKKVSNKDKNQNIVDAKPAFESKQIGYISPFFFIETSKFYKM